MKKEETIQKIIEFSKKAVAFLIECDGGCCEFELDGNLSLFIGWQDGYDQNEPGAIHSKESPAWCIVAGIKSNQEYLKTDYDFLTAPYDKKTMEVWDTTTTIDINEKALDKETIEYFLKEYQAMKKALKEGKITTGNTFRSCMLIF